MGLFDFLKPKFPARKQLTSLDERKIADEWRQIEVLTRAGKPSSLKEAVNRADKLMDFALLKIVDGETMGERLKAAGDRFSRDVYNKVWQAHKVRNNLAHELDYDPPHFITKEAIENFKVGFKELGIGI